jgi:hypothetical protein
MKTAAVLLVALVWIGGAVDGVLAEEQTLRGTISDSLCGASHAAMAAKEGSKVSDRDCVIACVNYSTENSPKLVFVDTGGKIYQISNQKFPGLIRHAGDRLAVTGDVNGTTVTISKLEVLPSQSK